MSLPPHEFAWRLHPEAEQVVDGLVTAALGASPRLRALADALLDQTSTRLVDWLDHLGGPIDTQTLADTGFVEGHGTTAGIWRHPAAQLPAIVPGERRLVALRVDDAAVFAVMHGSPVHAESRTRLAVEGTPRSGLRRVVVSEADRVVIAGVERRSWRPGVTPTSQSKDEALRAARAWALLAERPRGLGGAAEVDESIALFQQVVDLVGEDLAASYFLELERRYWQRRNTAAVLQHARQNRLGLGWGNNDHHTFRSSRSAFKSLIRLLVTLGFRPRERFYAGSEAGWGAQVLEHPGNGGVIFADVDLEPDEVDLDFSTVDLPDRGRLGTVGMWCALHGESILAAGMHHLEGQFEFDRLREDLGRIGVAHMRPFSDLPYLRQAFTEAERWKVPAARLDRLVADGHLEPAAAEEFRRIGAPGSHLENLARRNGFKGFNQSNVSLTMRATDPRIYRPAAVAAAAP